MKNIIKKLFSLFGLELKKKHVYPQYDYFRNEQMIAGMQRAYSRGLQSVGTAIDVGAAEGSWSLSAREIWPDAEYILFEPLHERKTILQNLAEQNPGFHFVSKAAGANESTLSFYVSDDLDGSGIAADTHGADKIRTVDATSIDIEIERLQLKPPYIVKLDTHGFEVPIIEGCASIIDQVSLFIIECYGFQIAPKSLLFWEMCRYMENKGFKLVDIVDVSLRPSDKVFWQCDAFFIPKNSPGLEINTFLT
jgi:FkbM family methyltransferase